MLKPSSMIVPIFFIANCTDAFKTQFINKKYGELSMSKKLRKPSLITMWVVSCGGSKGCYIISMDAMANIM